MTTIYLSRLELEPKSRPVLRDVANCQSLHHRIMQAFGAAESGQPAREHFGVLYRLERTSDEVFELVVQSKVEPTWSTLPDGYLSSSPELKEVGARYDTIESGMRLRFRLHANPTRKIDTKSVDGRRRNGRRVELTREEDQLAWLARKAEQSGFSIHGVRVSPQKRLRGRRKGVEIVFAGARYDGVVEVVDVVQFRSSLETGIGPAKAYGFGLLSVARAG